MAPKQTAIKGLTRSGRKKEPPSLAKLTCVPTATRPLPTSAPVKPCVVDTGKPITVANITVSPAPRATDRRKLGDAMMASGTSPLPEKFLTSSWAKKIEDTEPAKVVIVAHQMALP